MHTLKVLYRKNLKMSPGKIAAQSVHAALGLMKTDPVTYSGCIVLEVTDKQFEAHKFGAYVVTDAGKTEVEPGTETALAFWEGD